MLTKITCYKSLDKKVTDEIWENVVKYSNLVKSLLCWMWSSETHGTSGDKKLEEVKNDLIQNKCTYPEALACGSVLFTRSTFDLKENQNAYMLFCKIESHDRTDLINSEVEIQVLIFRI